MPNFSPFTYFHDLIYYLDTILNNIIFKIAYCKNVEFFSQKMQYY